MMFTVGDIVTVAGQDGTWVVAGPAINSIPPNRRWRTLTYERAGRTSRNVGDGDISLVKPAVTFAPGAKVQFHGQAAEVIEDFGDVVTVKEPDAVVSGVRIASNQTDAGKADLVLTNLRAVMNGDYDE